jgi:RNA-directed DNA polymerase
MYLLNEQKGRCAICANLLLHADREPQSPQEWEQWHRTTRKAITRHHIIASGMDGTPDGTRLVHSYCQRRATGARREPAPLYS